MLLTNPHTKKVAQSTEASEFENKLNMFFSGLHIYFLLGIIIMAFTNLAEAMGSASFDSPVPASK